MAPFMTPHENSSARYFSGDHLIVTFFVGMLSALALASGLYTLGSERRPSAAGSADHAAADRPLVDVVPEDSYVE